MKTLRLPVSRGAWRGLLGVLSVGLLCLGSPSTAQAQNTMPFTVKIRDVWTYVWSGNNQTITEYEISVKNESRERITGFTFTSGGTIGFYNPCWHWYGPSGTIESFSSGSQTIRISNMSNFTTGSETHWLFYFANPHTAIAAQTMFNNGTTPNAVVTVYGADGGRGELELSDMLSTSRAGTYTFKTEQRPRTLTVDSLTQGSTSSAGFVSNFVVRVRTPSGTLLHERITPSSKVTIPWLLDGDKVEIRAYDGVYLNANGQFIYDSRDIPTEEEMDASNPPRQRYMASGLSVNNTPQTGDPTQYSFDIQGDSAVDLRWRHDFALMVKHDFTATESPELDPTGVAWAGPLSSGAAGNPSPDTTKTHWIPKGESVIAQIDGQVIDFTRAGLDIRYVPKAYRAQGSARGVFSDEYLIYTNKFQVGQSPPQRQQVDAFVMNGWGSIDYVWQIQFGIQINIDDASRSALPRVFGINPADNSTTEVGSLEGTFWFNPGDPVLVASAANEGDAMSKALSGWVNGDGFYFSSAGDLNSQDGTLVNGGPAEDSAGPVALWTPSFYDSNGRLYRGLSIPSLRRPARVLWTYGVQVYVETVRIGEYVFQNSEALLASNPALATTVRRQPDMIQLISVSGRNKQVAESEMAIWDPAALRLYPLVPGQFRATWQVDDDTSVQVIVNALPPDKPHYPHIAGSPPVQLTPDPAGTFLFKELRYSENNAAIEEGSLFTADAAGRTVLLFSEIKQIGRGQPTEFLRVRMVETKVWNDAAPVAGEAIIGRPVADPGLDRAKLGTGHVKFEQARFNARVYDNTKLEGLRSIDVYDMAKLRSTAAEKVVVTRSALPGPVIPVNLHPGATAEERVVVVWYYDPTLTDGILWPYVARTYVPRWPNNAAEGLGRIVIASQYGSESVNALGNDQVVAVAITNLVVGATGGVATSIVGVATTYDPARIQQPAVYVQNNRALPGYNPNEEHALLAPSRRYAQVSPRPPAAYALRDNDLNRFNRNSTGEANQPTDYTSHPYVLVQYYDKATGSFAMRVYQVVKEDVYIDDYHFANQGLVTIPAGASEVAASPQLLAQEPYVRMEAGEPVIPFYPLGVVIGASPSPETFGVDLKVQKTYWEDHKGTSWAVSGGENAWFTYSIFYPMSPDFWWPPDEAGRVRYDADSGEKRAAFPNTGDSVAFLPSSIQSLRDLALDTVVPGTVEANAKPNKLLYKSDWPIVAPILKAGETLTFSGGEFRQDNPTMKVADLDGNVQTIQTPGLPGVLAFGVGEVVFDALNPLGDTELLTSSWTVRLGQVLEMRSVALPTGKFPGTLLPGAGKTRVSGGKYVFNSLPASLQKRVRYDPVAQYIDESGITVSGRLTVEGIVNDKRIGDNTLTASPPAVYVLEPCILTIEERDALLELSDEGDWTAAVEALYAKTRNPGALLDSEGGVDTERYLVGLQPQVQRDPVSGEPLLVQLEAGSPVMVPETDPSVPEPSRQFGPGLALMPNAGFLDPYGTIPLPDGSTEPFPDISWVTVAENNDPSAGGGPVTLHIIKVDRRERYRGAIQTMLSDNVFDENVGLRHTGDFGANADDLVFEWWYRPDDGSLNVPPPFIKDPDSAGPWKLFPDLSGKQGRGRFSVLLKGNPNTPETLLADSWWFVRYRHKRDTVSDTDWDVPQPYGADGVNYEWAGAGNNDPFNDFNSDGYPDYRAQLAMGWIKRVLDAVNPYEARIRDFEGENPSTVSSMLQQFGARYEGPVALNPDKNVIENVGLIELYETILERASALSINLSSPVSTPAIANALQLASTRLSDFYMLLANEAYTDAVDPTIGYGSDSTTYGSMAPVVHAFQNQVPSLLSEELALMRGADDYFARPVYNRLFWNFTKGEGEAAYAMNYNVTDINADGFINEDDAMSLYPQGHGDAWGHYLTAVRKQYDLLRHPYFNWVSRSESYNLMDIVIPVDFLDERKFARAAAARAKAGADIVIATYREKYVEDPTAQWQGYTDVEPDRAWGVQEWARRAGQGAFFDWVTANALLPSQHPNTELEGIQKADRQANDDIAVISANLNSIQRTFDDANNGLNPLGLAANVVPFDIDPVQLSADNEWGASHFEQIYGRAVAALNNAVAAWDYANEEQNRLRKVANTEAAFRNSVYQEDLSYRNRLVSIFGRPYTGTVGAGLAYPAGYDGPDLGLYMYVNVRELSSSTVPGPAAYFATFGTNGVANGGDLYTMYNGAGGMSVTSIGKDVLEVFGPSLYQDSTKSASILAKDGYYNYSYFDLTEPKVEFDNWAQILPITAAGYTFQAPAAWGSRPVVGELQMLINKMMQQQATIVNTIWKWECDVYELTSLMRMVNSKLSTQEKVTIANESFVRIKYIVQNLLKGIRGAKDIVASIGSQVESTFEAVAEFIPTTLPTAGLSISPGDALAPGRGAALTSKVVVKAGITTGELVLKIAELVAEIGLDVTENEKNLAVASWEREQEERELLKSIEDKLGQELVTRVVLFREIESLRALSDEYRSTIARGAKLIDERAAFNKRVAAQTQQNRYQDMTFRVSRNHALEVYHETLAVAARYAYLAAKAYDYETNLDVADPGSPRDLYADIVRARTPGLVTHELPRLGKGGLADVLARLKANYDALEGQLGFNNPQNETGKLSLRTELFRILPSGSVQPAGGSFPGGGQDSDVLWRQTLQNARVANVWEVPEYRYYARPFASDLNANGSAAVEPGIVLRFGTEIIAGRNVFGNPLSGGDHAYDSSVFATKIRSVGVWFSNYRSDNVLNDLPEAPRVYLFPVGADIMSIANSPTPDKVRLWRIVDQRIPVPFPAVNSTLDLGNFRPLLDSLNGRIGEPRRFSSFRAYHDAGATLDLSEVVLDSRLVGRSVWNTEWILIIPGLTLNNDPDVGLDRFINQVKDIKLIFQTYGHPGN